MKIINVLNNQFQLNTQNTSYVMHNENGIYTDKATGQTYYGSQLMNYGIRVATQGNRMDFYTMIWEFE